MKSNVALSSPAGWLRMSGAVRRPDGLWEPADVPKGTDFLPFNGEWGYLVLWESDRVRVARLEAWGIAWERELPEIPDMRGFGAAPGPRGAPPRIPRGGGDPAAPQNFQGGGEHGGGHIEP